VTGFERFGLIKQVYFDLTELFVASSKFRYYGISRVVAELAYELSRLDPEIQFVAFSPGHRKFFRLYPTFTPEVWPYLVVDINIPQELRPIRARLWFHNPSFLVRPFLRFRSWLIRIVDKRRWTRSGVAFTPLEIKDGILISMGRPKLMVEFLNSIPLQSKVRFFPLLHDVMPLSSEGRRVFGLFFSNFLADTNLVITRAASVLVNSFSTKQELLRFEQAGALTKLPPIKVIQLAHECRESTEPTNISLPGESYLLCVGTTLGRKNLTVVLDALVMLEARGRLNYSLVLAGTMRRRVISALASKKYRSISHRVLPIIDPNQAELIVLYKNCSALILPSFIEGWGLPAGEALWLQRPVICSDIPVLREVCRDQASFFDPRNAESLANLIEAGDFLSFKESVSEGTFSSNSPVNSRQQVLRSWQRVAEDLLEQLP
jgi:glycosyltransferase involved in cell wall biosynthesis